MKVANAVRKTQNPLVLQQKKTTSPHRFAGTMRKPAGRSGQLRTGERERTKRTEIPIPRRPHRVDLLQLLQHRRAGQIELVALRS